MIEPTVPNPWSSRSEPVPECSRRLVLGGGAAFVTGLLWPSAPASAAVAAHRSSLPPSFPTQDPAVVREVVGVAHGGFDRLRELVDPQPELAKATWDWGFGDWETALGAASHVGRRDIAEYLIDHGARPDVFTATMLGDLAAVRAFLTLRPGLQSQPGPHGIPLLAHARAGGEPARAVVAYLEELGGADGPEPVPIDDEALARYVGRYRFGPGPQDHFEVGPSRMGGIAIERAEGTPRGLRFQGGHEFHPAGAPSARIRFSVRDGRVEGLEIWNPGRVVAAQRES